MEEQKKILRSLHMEGFKLLQAQPGKLQLSVAKVKNNKEMATAVEERFGAIKGINHVEADPGLGTVQILYDKDELTSLFNLWSLKDTFSALFPEVNAFELLTLLGDNY
jgi:hypothetical protein